MIRVLRSTVMLSCAVLQYGIALAEEQTEPERIAEQLGELTERKYQSLTKRWEGLIRRRQWTSASGKHKTYAKYVDHAPDLSWVKLLVLVKSGEEQTEKEIQIPSEKLDKKGRAILNRIALARKEVEEALAGSESTIDQGRSDAQPSPTREQRTSTNREPSDASPEEDSRPDPNKPLLSDDAPWRKSYEKFIGNLSATKIDPDGDEHDPATWQLEWGELHAIRREWESMTLWSQAQGEQIPRERALEAQEMVEEASPRVGEVVWEGVLKKRVPRSGEIEFDFPQPPRPFDIAFFLDEENPGSWERFKPGDKLRFIGRFQSYGIGTPTITLHIRLPNEQPGDRASENMALGLPPGLEEEARKHYRNREQ